MTREEAGMVLKNTAFMLKDGTKYMKDEHIQQFHEAYEMAISVLVDTPINIPIVIDCKDCIYLIGKYGGKCPVQSTGDPCYADKPDADWFCGDRKRSGQ